MSAHTPGPWVAILEDGIWDIWSESESSVDYSIAYLDAVDVWNPDLNAEANAHLIAAAPDLLAALERAICWLDAAGVAETMPVQQQARAAIAKAKGEA